MLWRHGGNGRDYSDYGEGEGGRVENWRLSGAASGLLDARIYSEL